MRILGSHSFPFLANAKTKPPLSFFTNEQKLFSPISKMFFTDENKHFSSMRNKTLFTDEEQTFFTNEQNAFRR